MLAEGATVILEVPVTWPLLQVYVEIGAPPAVACAAKTVLLPSHIVAGVAVGVAVGRAEDVMENDWLTLQAKLSVTVTK